MSGRAKVSPGIRLAVDYLPLVLFFVVNFLIPGDMARRLVALTTVDLGPMTQIEAALIAKVLVATVVFIVAEIAALAFSHWKLGGISPMLWVTAVLVVVFGGLTIYYHDPKFIQMKPTFVYAIFAATLGFGLATGRPLLEQMLGAVYPGLTAEGWRRLTINWAIFFAVMAVLNEVVWRVVDNVSVWLAFKVWGVIPLTLIFALANVPMLLKHGLSLDGGSKSDTVEAELPPE